MTYHQSAKGEMITWARAVQELKDHGVFTLGALGAEELERFQKECWEAHAVNNEEISAHHVLGWLGY